MPLTAQDAADIQNALPYMEGEERDKASSLLERFKTEKTRSFFTGGLKGVDAVAPGITETLTYNPNPDEYRAKVANTQFLAHRYNKPTQEIAAAYPLYTRDYAQKWGDYGEENDLSFYREAGKEIQSEVDREDLIFGKSQPDGLDKGRKTGGLVQSATLAALLDDKNGFAAWQAANRANPGYRAEDEETYLKAWSTARQHIDDTLGPHRATVRNMVRSLQAQTGADDSNGWAVWAHPEQQLFELKVTDPKAYQVALAAIQEVGQRATKQDKAGFMGWMQRLGENFSRGTSNIVDGGIEATQYGSARLADALGMEDRASIIRARPDVYRDLRDIANGVIDPAGSLHEGALGILENGLFTFAQSAPMMLIAKHPAGQMMLVGGYTADAYKNLRDNGWTGAGAEAAALGVGVFSAAVETASEMIPGIGGALQKMGVNPTGKSLARSLIRISGKAATEVGEEFVQDLAAPAVQTIMHAAFDAVPDRPEGHKLKQEVDDWLKVENLGPLLVSVLPLALLGASVHSRADMHAEKVDALTANPAELQKLFPPDVATKIAAEPDGEARAQLVREAWDKQSAEQRLERLKLSADLQAAQQQAETAAAKEAESQAIRVTRNAQGWQVTSADGATVTTSSAEAARRIREDLRQASTEHEAEAIVALADDWHAKAGPNTERSTSFTGETVRSDGDSITHSRNGEVIRQVTDAGMLDTLRREAAMDAEASGYGPIDVLVNGSNTVEFRQRVADAAAEIAQRLDIHQSASPALTFVHESVESMWKTGLQQGTITMDETQRAIAAVASAFDPARARDAEERSLRERVQRIADGMANATEVRETVSELAVAEIIGRRKDGRATPAGAISRALDAAITNATDAAEARLLGKFQAMLRAVRQWFRAVMGTVAAIKKAKRDGKLKEGDDYHLFMEKLLGLDGYERAVADGMESLGAEAGGESFSLTPSVKYWDSLENIKHPPERSPLRYRTASQRMAFELKAGDIISPQGSKDRYTVTESRRHGGLSHWLQFANGSGVSANRLEAYEYHGRTRSIQGERQAGKGGENQSTAIEAGESHVQNDGTEGEPKEGLTSFSLSPMPSPLRLLDQRRKGNNLDDHELRNPAAILRALGVRDDHGGRIRRGDGAALAGAEVRADDAGAGREGAGADAKQRGKSGNRVGSHSQFVAWARENGREIDPAPFRDVSEANFGGEHTVFLDLATGRVVKLTKPGLYGAHAEDAGAYLQRLALANRIFGDDLMVEGITQLPGEEETRAVISQPFIFGRDATNSEIKDYLQGKGFIEHKGVWMHPIRGVKVWDTITPGNVLTLEDGSSQAIDLVAEMMKKADLREVRERSGFGRDTSFSLAPSRRLDLVQNRLRLMLDTKPEGTRKFIEKATDNLRKLRSQWASMPQPQSKAQLDRGQARMVEARREALEEELVGRVEFETGGLALMPELAKLTEHPLAALLRTSASARKRYYAWRLEPPSKWRARQLEQFGEIGGDYDAADGLPRVWFQGSESPDQLAEEAFEEHLIAEPTPDALWTGIGKMLDDVATNRERLHKAQDRIREAKAEARREAEYEGKAWRFEQDAQQQRLGNVRQAAVRDVAMLEAVTAALPAEVRNKLPRGLAGLAGITSDRAFAEEIHRRIRKIDDALTAHWKEQNADSLTRLLARAQGKREGGKKPQGTAGVAVHQYFEYAAKVVAMPPAELIGEQAKVDAAQEAAIGTDEEVQWIEKRQILDTWGGFNSMHVAAQSEVLNAGWELYNNGRRDWIASEQRRLQRGREHSAALVEQVGQGLYEKIAKGQSLRHTAGRIAVEMRDFEGVLAALLSRDHPLTQRWAGEVSRGFAHKEDAMRALRTRWQAALDTAMPGLSHRKQKLRLYEMRTKRGIAVQIEEEKANPRLSSKDKEDLLQRGIQPELVKSSVKLTEDEALFLTMTARQSQYREALSLAGWNPAKIAEVEKALSPEAKALREWMASEYDAGHAPLSAVFERVRGLKLPKIANYSPGRFYNWGNEKPLDVMGTGTVNGGFADGFLVDRKAHFAQVKLASALGVFWTHQNESLHWQALAEPVREMRGTLRHPDVKRAIEGAWGETGTQLLESWMQAIEGNGIKHNAGASEKLVAWATSNFAVGKLAYNAATVVKQSMAVMNTALDVPFGMFIMGAGEVVKNPGRFLDVYRSDVIQRRMETGYSPEVRMLLDKFWTSKPGFTQDAMEKGMEFLGFADAFFTSISAAVAYEGHARAAEKAGMTSEQAHRIGMEKMEESVARTAQPQTADRRSIMEHRATGLGKLATLFLTESRQKAALWLEAWQNTLSGKATARDVKNLVLSHLVLAPMMAAISAAIRDWRDGPDDGDDDPAWELSDFAIAALIGPLQGLPLIGQVFGALSDAVAGRHSSSKSSNVLADPVSAVMVGTGDLLTDAFDGKNHSAEAEATKILRIMQNVGGVPGVLANVAAQAQDAADQVGGKKGRK